MHLFGMLQLVLKKRVTSTAYNCWIDAEFPDCWIDAYGHKLVSTAVCQA